MCMDEPRPGPGGDQQVPPPASLAQSGAETNYTSKNPQANNNLISYLHKR